MKREWAPGDVALVNSWRGKGQIAFRCERVKDEPTWCVLDGTDTRGLYDDEVTAARPVAVIDPEDREQVERLMVGWPGPEFRPVGDVDQMQAALREYADPKPPKPEEPTGLGAVVEDAEGVRWVKVNAIRPNFRQENGERPGWYQPYADIDVVRVLSEGVAE